MISVLYVDDEPSLLEIAKIYLERTGQIQVDTLESAVMALEVMKTHSYDAVVSDYQMPKMDGIVFLKAVRASWPTLPFIIFTGRRREEIVIEALNCGVDQYLKKGGEPKSQFVELEHAILRSVERQRANDTILHLNRLYSVVSRINRAVIRIRNREELFMEACRIAVDEGKFLMAWIGMVETATHSVIPVASCGHVEGYLSNISVSTDIVPTGMGLTGTAIREARVMISNDIASDSRMKNYLSEAARFGLCADPSVFMIS